MVFWENFNFYIHQLILISSIHIDLSWRFFTAHTILVKDSKCNENVSLQALFDKIVTLVTATLVTRPQCSTDVFTISWESSKEKNSQLFKRNRFKKVLVVQTTFLFCGRVLA